MAIIAKKPAADAKPKTTRAKKVVEAPVEVVYVSPFEVGHRVSHSTFGNGEVVEISKNQLSIRFDDKSTKTIIDGFVTRAKS